MEENRFDLFCRLTGSAAKSIQRLEAVHMDAFNLSAAHTQTLCLLLDAMPRGLTQTELAQAIGMDRAQVSRVLRTLRAHGCLAPSGESGYKNRYLLTQAGLQVAHRVRAAVLQVHAYVSEGIPQEDLACFYRTFARICDRLQSAVTRFGMSPQDDAGADAPVPPQP